MSISEVDAAFIIRAVNHHDALLSTLEDMLTGLDMHQVKLLGADKARKAIDAAKA